MSIATLHRSLSTYGSMTIKEAAANYNSTAAGKLKEFFKGIFSLGGTYAYRKFFAEPAKQKSVENLISNLQNRVPDAKVITFKFENKDYHVYDHGGNLYVTDWGMPLGDHQENMIFMVPHQTFQSLDEHIGIR